MKLNSKESNLSSLWKKWDILIPWLTFPFLCLGFYFLSIYKKPFLLIAKEQKKDSLASWYSFSDKIDNGNSECLLIATRSGLSYRYTLNPGADYQYAGVWHKTN